MFTLDEVSNLTMGGIGAVELKKPQANATTFKTGNFQILIFLLINEFELNGT